MPDKVVSDWPLPGVLRLCLARPERHNAVDHEVVDGLMAALEGDGRRAAVVLLCSEGSFCAGMDLRLPVEVRAAVSKRLYELYSVMVSHERPVIASVRGHAIGAGAQLLLASDLRVAAFDATVRFPGPAHGLAVGTWGLPSLLGRGRAFDLSLTMRDVGAEEALRIGLLDRLAEDPDEEALGLAATISKLDPAAVRDTKALVAQATGLKEALDKEARRNATVERGHSEGS